MLSPRSGVQLRRGLWTAPPTSLPVDRIDPRCLWRQGRSGYRAKLRRAGGDAPGRLIRRKEGIGAAWHLYIQGAIAVYGNLGRWRRVDVRVRSTQAADAAARGRNVARKRSNRFQARHVCDLRQEVRYYAEKKLIERTKIAAPEMPTIRIDPAVANNSLRVIAAAEAAGDNAGVPTSASPAGAVPETASVVAPLQRRLSKAAIDAAKAVPPGDRARKLFEHIVVVAPPHAASTPQGV